MKKKKEESNAIEEKKLKAFLEQKRLDALAAKQEAQETRQLVNQVKDSGANQNIITLLSNYQGIFIAEVNES